MKNSWNRFIYACWAPVYDRFVGVSPFVRARRRTIDSLHLQPGDRLLIVGIGTGADLILLPDEIDVVGIDFSRPMLRIAARKSSGLQRCVQLIAADAAQLPFRRAKFDAVLLSLIVSVVADPEACLAEVTRVSSPDCRIVVFDKFLHGKAPSIRRRMANVVTRLFGTDINRDFNKLLTNSGLKVVVREPAAFDGAYELIGLRHESCTAE